MHTIPKAITKAAVSMLSPYNPALTPERLEAAIFKPEEKAEDRLRTRQEGKEILNVSLPTIDRMLASGELVKVKVRGRVMIPQRSIDSVISGNEVSR